MDKQTILDRVAAFLHAQGGPGRQHNGCFYRTCDGRKSALGSLIPDELYNEALEDREPADLPRYIFDALDAESDDEIAFLVGLETAHDTAARSSGADDAAFWSEWVGALENLVAGETISLAQVHALGPPQARDKQTRSPLAFSRLGKPPLIWPRS